MQASNIIELNGRGIPAILHSAKIVDVCAYLKSSGTPAALVLSDRGDVRGVLAEGDIIGAAGRLGSSVMQMMAGELMREQAPVCQSDTTIVEVLEVLGETASDFVLVTEGGVIKGLVTFQDVAELLTSAMAGGDAEAADMAAAAETAPVELQAALQSAQEAPAEEVAASAVVAPTAAHQPEASVTVTGQDEVQFAAFDPAQVAPAAHAEVAQPAPQMPEAAPAPQMPEAAPAPQAPAQQAVQPVAQPDLAQPAAMAAPAAEAVAAPAPSAVSAPDAAAMPTVSSLLQGKPAAAAPAPQVPAPQVPGANAYAPPAQAEQSSQAPISAAAAAARAIAARMQAPQADFAAPGSPATEAQAPGASARAGWASFKAG
jgi:CBS domain-containing protein